MSLSRMVDPRMTIPAGQSLHDGCGQRPRLRQWEGDCRRGDGNNDTQMNVSTGVGISIDPNGNCNNSDHTLSLAQEVEDSKAKPQVAPRELRRLCRGGQPPATTKGGLGNGNVEVPAVRATRWTRPASDKSGMGTSTRSPPTTTMITC